jgi:hypothetical protein
MLNAFPQLRMRADIVRQVRGRECLARSIAEPARHQRRTCPGGLDIGSNHIKVLYSVRKGQNFLTPTLRLCQPQVTGSPGWLCSQGISRTIDAVQPALDDNPVKPPTPAALQRSVSKYREQSDTIGRKYSRSSTGNQATSLSTTSTGPVTVKVTPSSQT